jgi:hypothetical protein
MPSLYTLRGVYRICFQLTGKLKRHTSWTCVGGAELAFALTKKIISNLIKLLTDGNSYCRLHIKQKYFVSIEQSCRNNAQLLHKKNCSARNIHITANS